MRLINCTTLQLEEFFGNKIPPYAILSHTWGDEEVTFGDLPLNQPSTQARAGYRKIEYTCKQARGDGLDYAWVDTCCIDKSSSAELSEAINSMFAWYRNSACCYAYLVDVKKSDIQQSLPKSRWFTRGWTLQELLAPRDVIFYDRRWNKLFTKSTHARYISKITKIAAEALSPTEAYPYEKPDFDSFCVAQRMSWASHRETARIEDTAYCLLGLFDVNMPLLYGEGERAFLRLQQEIIRKVNDDSILAWGLNEEVDIFPHLLEMLKVGITQQPNWHTSVLARSPKDFENSSRVKHGSRSGSRLTITNMGLQIQLPIVSVFKDPDSRFAEDEVLVGLLGCSTGSFQEFLGILLFRGWDWSHEGVNRMTTLTHPFAWKTIVVGSRIAMRSEMQGVIITDDDRRVETFQRRGTAQILVNVTSNLHKLGHRVQRGMASGLTEMKWRTIDPTWHRETKILDTGMGGNDVRMDLFEFLFKASWGDQSSTFTVFMQTQFLKAFVRKGTTFSEDEKHCLLEYRPSTASEKENITIQDREGNAFEVRTEVRLTEVYDRKIFELNVDAVPVASVYYQHDHWA